MTDVIKANFIVFLHDILNFETRTPPKIWPRAAPGIKTAPNEKEGNNKKTNILTRHRKQQSQTPI